MIAVHVVAALNVDTGGPAVSVPRLADAVARAGAPTQVISLDYPALGPRTSVRAASQTVIPAGPITRALRGLSPALRRAIEAAARGSRLVHNHGMWMAPNVYARRSAVGNKRPLVISPRGMLEPWALRRSAWSKKIAWVMYERANLEACRLFHATSPQECASIREGGFRQPIALIPNGVDLDECAAPGPRSRQRVLFMGRLHPVKGIDELLRAWAGLGSQRAGWDLQIVGPDFIGYAPQLRAAIASLNLEETVRLAGPVAGEAKRQAFADAAVFVLPSRSESFGLAVAEALASGLPVITTTATPWRGISEKRCGWLTEPNVPALAQALRDAIAAGPERRAAMGRSGADWVRAEFSWDSIGRRMAAVYRWLLDGGAAPADVQVA